MKGDKPADTDTSAHVCCVPSIYSFGVHWVDLGCTHCWLTADQVPTQEGYHGLACPERRVSAVLWPGSSQVLAVLGKIHDWVDTGWSPTATAVPPHQMTTWHVWGRVCIYTQGSMFIYAPVWVDEFSPARSQTKWMSLLQVRPRVLML